MQTSKEYPIGTQYMSLGKHPQVCTIVDLWKTYNAAGELVRTGYVSTHDFCGQQVVERDVNTVTIARGIARLSGKPF